VRYLGHWLRLAVPSRAKGGIYEFTCQFASMQPPPPEMQQLLHAVSSNPEAMDGFARVFSGVVSPAEFFFEENVKRIFAMAH
jgi:hypothetical protein